MNQKNINSLIEKYCNDNKISISQFSEIIGKNTTYINNLMNTDFFDVIKVSDLNNILEKIGYKILFIEK